MVRLMAGPAASFVTGRQGRRPIGAAAPGRKPAPVGRWSSCRENEKTRVFGMQASNSENTIADGQQFRRNREGREAVRRPETEPSVAGVERQPVIGGATGWHAGRNQ